MLKKSLYNLNQSARMWYQNFDTYIQGLQFVRSMANHCLYYKKVGENFIYVVLYVNDMLLVGNNMEVIKEVKTKLSFKLDMKDLYAANLILGMEIKINCVYRKIWLNQRKYLETILHMFNTQECKPIKVHIPIGVMLFVVQCPKTWEEEEDMSFNPYASLVGSLMYAMVCTRQNIAHAVGVLSRYMLKLRKDHQTTYHGTTYHPICYQGRAQTKRVLDVHGFVDGDQDGDMDHKIPTSGYVLNLFGGAINWMRTINYKS